MTFLLLPKCEGRYGVSNLGVWKLGLGPHPDKLQEELEKVQNRAARFFDQKSCLWNWEYDWHSWTIEMGIP